MSLVTKEFDDRLSVRCTSRMKTILEEKSMKEGLTLSEYVRDILFNECMISEKNVERK